MPRYRVLAKSFIGARLCEEGDEVDYEGEAGANLERIKAAPERKAAKPAPPPPAPSGEPDAGQQGGDPPLV